MNWFYAHEGKQIGPVTEEEFQQLRASGVIAAGTLVWREGMANWQPLGELTAPAAPTPPPALNPGAAALVCSGCGQAFPADEVVRLGDGFVCAACKPVALQRLREGVAASDVEDIRNEHIKHEAAARGASVVYVVGPIILVGNGILFVLQAAAPRSAGAITVLVVLFVIGVPQLAAGVGMWRLKPWARPTAGMVAALSCLVLPFSPVVALFAFLGPMIFLIGIIINGFILYLLFSKKGKMVFSPEYQEVIAQTPHIKYRTSIIVWIILAAFLILFGALLFFTGSRTIQSVPVGP